MNNYFIVLIISTIFCLKSMGQCNVPQNTFADNIYFFSAQLNWTSVSGVYHYKIRYKEIGTTP